MPRFVSVPAVPGLLALPWHLPLEEWPQEHLVALPRGISRHVVRFIRLGGHVYAVKEAPQRYVEREHRLLRDLERLDVPAVEPVGYVLDRAAADGGPIDPMLVTRHLSFSLPYRAVFSRTLRPETVVQAGRRAGRAAGTPAPHGLLLGRLLAVQHVVPQGRRRFRRVPRRRRDRRAARRTLTGPTGVRPRPCPHQHLRRASRPAGGRLSVRGHRAARTLRSGRRALPAAVERADRRRGVRHRRAATGSRTGSNA